MSGGKKGTKVGEKQVFCFVCVTCKMFTRHSSESIKSIAGYINPEVNRQSGGNINVSVSLAYILVTCSSEIPGEKG